MMRVDKEKMRKAGEEIARNRSEFPEIASASQNQRVYNAHIEDELRQNNEETNVRVVSEAIQNAAITTYGKQAKKAIKQKHNLRAQPWDRSEQTKKLRQERGGTHGHLISLHKQIAKCHKQYNNDPTQEKEYALRIAQGERDNILRKYREQTKALKQARQQDFNDFPRLEAEKIEQEDGEIARYKLIMCIR